MKRFLSIAVVSLAVVGLSVAAFAQQAGPQQGQQQKGQHQKGQHQKGQHQKGEAGRHANRKHGDVMKRFAEKLNLTAEQKQRIQILRDQTKARLQALKDAPGTKESKMAKLQEIRKSSKEEFQGILTAEQKAKLAEMKKNFKDHMKNRKGGVDKGGRGAKNKAGKGGGIGA